jgi:hypothetical protein
MAIKCGIKNREVPFTRAEMKLWCRKLDAALVDGYRAPHGQRRPVALSKIDAKLATVLNLGELPNLAAQLMHLSPLESARHRQERLNWMAQTLLALALLARWDRMSLSAVGEQAIDYLLSQP